MSNCIAPRDDDSEMPKDTDKVLLDGLWKQIAEAVIDRNTSESIDITHLQKDYNPYSDLKSVIASESNRVGGKKDYFAMTEFQYHGTLR